MLYMPALAPKRTNPELRVTVRNALLILKRDC